MRKNPQIGALILALAGFAALPGMVWAQKPHNDRPPQAQNRPAPQAHAQNQNRPNANRPQGNANHPANPNAPNNRPAQNNFNNPNRGNNAQGAGMVHRQPGANSAQKPWVDTMRDLSPRQREQVLQHSRVFQQLPPDKQSKIRQQFAQWDRMTPGQRADLQEREQKWRQLTPGQRDFIRNSANPRFQQLPWDRQQVLTQKLGVLQNMPESARNQRLSDPGFTKGMSDEEKSVLNELAHTHVGAPDSPNE